MKPTPKPVVVHPYEYQPGDVTVADCIDGSKRAAVLFLIAVFLLFVAGITAYTVQYVKESFNHTASSQLKRGRD